MIQGQSNTQPDIHKHTLAEKEIADRGSVVRHDFLLFQASWRDIAGEGRKGVLVQTCQ